MTYRLRRYRLNTDKEPLSQKEIDHQLAVGSMSRGDAFVEHIKRTVKPVPWPTTEELHKVYPDLKEWMTRVDNTIGEVIKQFDIFFTDEEVNSSNSNIYINFMVNTRFCEDWSEVMTGDEDCDNKIEVIFEHLQIISPLMVANIDCGPYVNIDTNTDS